MKLLTAACALLSLPATFLAVTWAALQPPLAAGLFYLASLALWLVYSAWRHYVVRTPPLPIPRLLAALAPFALAVSLGRRLFPLAAGFLQNGLAIVVCLAAVILPGLLHACLGRLPFLRPKDPESKPPAIDQPDADRGWRDLPNGLRYRTAWGGEIAMGGPLATYHFFSNGIELGDGSLILSADGRYAACNDLRNGSPLLLADLENGIVRKCAESDEVHAIRTAGPRLDQVKHLLGRPGSVQYVRVRGLWVSPDQAIPPDSLILPDRQGRPRLRLERHVDEAMLQAADEPLACLLTAKYTAHLDDEPLPLFTHAPDCILWSDDGDLLLVPATASHSDVPGSHWLWRQDGTSGWVTPLAWKVEESLPSGALTGVSEIDADGYWADLTMNRPSDTGYPQRTLALRFPSSFTCGARPSEWITGADARGRLVIRQSDGAEYSLRVRLPWRGSGDAALIESCLALPSEADSATALARFVPQPGGASSGLRRYRVEAGAATANDVSLFHLWSDCGRFLVLQPHVGRGEAADRFFVLDTVSGRRLDSDFRGSGLQLLGWAYGELQVGVALGCVPDTDNAFDPFTQFDPPPRPEEDGSLHRKWLLTEAQRFRIEADGGRLAGPLRKCIDLTQPPYPNAAFDFRYRAPAGDRSVFVFGARNEYQDHYDRAQCCRYQARAVTSDGICLEGLGVGMIWSPDARYLVVTGRVPPEHPEYDDLAWKARLIDCERRLLYPEIALGCMPIFETWTDDGIDYRQVDADWWREDVETRPARLLLADLLAGEAEALREQEGLWLPVGNAWHPQWPLAFAQAYGAYPRR